MRGVSGELFSVSVLFHGKSYSEYLIIISTLQTMSTPYDVCQRMSVFIVYNST